MNAKDVEQYEQPHDASASAEVVVGPKICLYWNRDGPYVAGLRACGGCCRPCRT